jgi:hypothetical protein
MWNTFSSLGTKQNRRWQRLALTLLGGLLRLPGSAQDTLPSTEVQLQHLVEQTPWIFEGEHVSQTSRLNATRMRYLVTSQLHVTQLVKGRLPGQRVQAVRLGEGVLLPQPEYDSTSSYRYWTPPAEPAPASFPPVTGRVLFFCRLLPADLNSQLPAEARGPLPLLQIVGIAYPHQQAFRSRLPHRVDGPKFGRYVAEHYSLVVSSSNASQRH